MLVAGIMIKYEALEATVGTTTGSAYDSPPPWLLIVINSATLVMALVLALASLNDELGKQALCFSAIDRPC